VVCFGKKEGGRAAVVNLKKYKKKKRLETGESGEMVDAK